MLALGTFDPLSRYSFPRERLAPPSDRAPPRICYIPGLDGTSGSPFVQWPALGEAGYEIRVQDVRSRPVPASFDATVDQVIDLLRDGDDHEQTRGRVTLLMGESYGAVVAAAAAVREPSLVSGLILVNPATAFSQKPALQREAALLRAVPAALFVPASFAILGRKTFDLGFLATAVKDILIDRKLDALRESDPALAGYYDAALAELTAEVSQLPPRDFMCSRLEHLADGCEQVEAAWQALEPPTLVIAGTADQLLESDVEAARLLRVLGPTRCATHLVDGAGHAGTLDQRCDLAKLLAKWTAQAGIQI